MSTKRVSWFRIVMQELDLEKMNQIIENYMLQPMRARLWPNMPPVFLDACEQAKQSQQWTQKAFVVLLLAYTSKDFQDKLFDGEEEAIRLLMMKRFQLFFDAFIKGLRVCDNKLTRFKADSSRCERSYGWVLWELRSYSLQL